MCWKYTYVKSLVCLFFLTDNNTNFCDTVFPAINRAPYDCSRVNSLTELIERKILCRRKKKENM